MYQYAYMYENMDCNYRKAMVNVDAYTEGYAVYAGYEGLKYLDEVQQPLLEIYKEDELGTYCLVVSASTTKAGRRSNSQSIGQNREWRCRKKPGT